MEDAVAANIEDAIEISDLVLVMRIQRRAEAEGIGYAESARRVFEELAARELAGSGRVVRWADRQRA